MRRSQGPSRPLLRTIGNQSTHPSRDNGSQSTSHTQLTAPKVREPTSFDAPPLSSDEDDDEDDGPGPSNVDTQQQKSLLPLASLEADDSGDDQLSNADIKPTSFAKKSSSVAYRNSTKGAVKPATHAPDKKNASYQETPCSSAGSKRSGELFDDGSPDPLTDQSMGSFSTRGDKKIKATYSGKQTKQIKPTKPKIRPPKTSYKRLHESSQSREDKQTPPPAPKFKSYDFDDTPEKTDSARFQTPDDTNLSPDKSPRRAKLRHHSFTPDDTPKKPKFNSFSNLSFDETGSTVKEELSGLDDLGLPRKPKFNRCPDLSLDETGPSVEDGLSDLDDLEFGDDIHPVLGKSLVKLNDGDVAYKTEGGSSSPEDAKCPMCHERVDPLLLKRNLKQGRISVKKQMAFCKLHQRRNAATSGIEKGYPKIDWEDIEIRLARHLPVIKEILEGKRSSKHADMLRSTIDSGKNRTLLTTDDGMTPGYYGPRGLRVMTEYLVRNLSSVIRRRAVEDRVISARGHTGYVQAVLVPELATRLIMEDMSIDESHAKRVLRESIEVGELLYEDGGDVVANRSDDEE